MKRVTKRRAPESLTQPMIMGLTLLSIVFSARCAHGQASTNPLTPDQTMVPVTGTPTSYQADTSTLSYVNSNAATMQYIDRAQGPYTAGIEIAGNGADNIFDASQHTIAGGYFSAAVPLSFRWISPRTLFAANYRVDGEIYPGYSSINSVSQTYLQRWAHSPSTKTNYFWDVAAARITSLGQYLPISIPIGGIGVTQPSVPGDVLENSYVISDAITTAGFVHRLSTKDDITGSVTAGWIEEQQEASAPGTPRQILRSEPVGVDFQYNHLITGTTTLGGEVTNLYVRGLSPVGHDDYTAIEATAKHYFSPYLVIRGAVGPLVNVASSYVSQSNTVTYAALAAVDYLTPYARMTAEYSRVIQVEYLAVPVVAHQISGLFDRPIARNYDITAQAVFIHSDAIPLDPAETDYGITGRLDRYFGRSLSVFVSASRFQRIGPPSTTLPISYARDQVAVGLRYLFGAPLDRQGASK